MSSIFYYFPKQKFGKSSNSTTLTFYHVQKTYSICYKSTQLRRRKYLIHGTCNTVTAHQFQDSKQDAANSNSLYKFGECHLFGIWYCRCLRWNLIWEEAILKYVWDFTDQLFMNCLECILSLLGWSDIRYRFKWNGDTYYHDAKNNNAM